MSSKVKNVTVKNDENAAPAPVAPEIPAETVAETVATSVEFKGKSYDIDAVLFQTMKSGVTKKYPTLAEDKRDEILEGMLKTFLKPGKEYAKIERAAEVKAYADKVNTHDTIKPLLGNCAAMFKGYNDGTGTLEKAFGAKAKITESGEVQINLPLSEKTAITLGSVYKTFGLATIRPYTDKEGKTMVEIRGDVPSLSKAKETYMAALGELDKAITNVIDRTNLKIGYNTETGLVEVADATQKQAGAPRSGPSTKGGKVKVDATGKEYSGTHQQLFEAMQKDGFKFSDTILKWKAYSYIVNGRVAGVTVLEKYDKA